MMVNALWTDPKNTGVTFGIILLGIPVYVAWRVWSKKSQPQMNADKR
jgi:predicted negative regulator of RcsB-dependent stress response